MATSVKRHAPVGAPAAFAFTVSVLGREFTVSVPGCEFTVSIPGCEGPHRNGDGKTVIELLSARQKRVWDVNGD